jgi:Protein of unknown function (DUF2585)
MTTLKNPTTRDCAKLGIAAVILVAAIEYAMGRVLYCACGYVKLWHGVVNSSENSQHITDWYTFSHVIHGIIFFCAVWLLGKKVPLSAGAKLLLALLFEGAWEVLENSPFIIDRYRTTTISLDYYGDSVINSVSDVLAMVLGFLFARKVPVWASIALVLFLELMTLFFIRDNLTLNIVMLVHPIDAIRAWQSGA